MMRHSQHRSNADRPAAEAADGVTNAGNRNTDIRTLTFAYRMGESTAPRAGNMARRTKDMTHDRGGGGRPFPPSDRPDQTDQTTHTRVKTPLE